MSELLGLDEQFINIEKALADQEAPWAFAQVANGAADGAAAAADPEDGDMWLKGLERLGFDITGMHSHVVAMNDIDAAAAGHGNDNFAREVFQVNGVPVTVNETLPTGTAHARVWHKVKECACGKSYDKWNDLDRHIFAKNGGMYHCPFCGKHSNRPDNFKTHLSRCMRML